MPLLAEKKSGTGYALHFGSSEPAIIHNPYFRVLNIHRIDANHPMEHYQRSV